MPFRQSHGSGSQNWSKLSMAQSTTKVPPGWSEDISSKSPFHRWHEDLTLRMSSTELEPYKIGPAVALRLGGTAKEIALAQMKRPAHHPSSGVIGDSLQCGETMDFEDCLALLHRTGVGILVHNLLLFKVRPIKTGINLKRFT